MNKSSPYLLLVGCLLMAAFDGFDVQAIGFAAPRIATLWSVPVAEFWIVFSLGLFGLLLGGLFLAPLADRFGRRRTVLLGALWIAVSTAVTALCTSIAQLTALRLATGLGLGAVIPVLVTIAHEGAPAGRSIQWVTLMTSGFPAGGFVGGLFAAWALPLFGWSKFFIGMGVVCLLLILPLWLVLGETRLNPADVAGVVLMPRPAPPGIARRIVSLFQGGNTVRTVLIWLLFIVTLLNMYSLANWLPTLLERELMLPADAARAAAIANLGGMAGGIFLGWLSNARGLGVLAVGYGLAAVLLVALGISVGQVGLVYALCFAVGFLVPGGHVCNIAVAAAVYSTEIRATGVGWAQGIGRIGAIIGPAAVGAALSSGWKNPQIFTAGAVFAVVSCIAVSRLSRPGVLQLPARSASLASYQ
jgi:MFS transporter, AAHS family, 4-hydroxybenzoate transporter